MPPTEQPDDPPRRPHIHSAEDARGAEIILRSRRRRIVFFAGLVGLILLVLILSLVRLSGA